MAQSSIVTRRNNKGILNKQNFEEQQLLNEYQSKHQDYSKSSKYKTTKKWCRHRRIACL